MVSLFKSLKAMLFFTILLGVIYPFFIMGTGYILNKDKATGSLVSYNSKVVGSSLIGQQMPDNLFQSRPSASNYNPLKSGGSNYAVNNKEQLKLISTRIAKLQEKYGDAKIPEGLIFASASGLDPDITLQSAKYQIDYVAKTNDIDKKEVKKLVDKYTDHHLFNPDTVDVLKLNIALLKLINKNSTKSLF